MSASPRISNESRTASPLEADPGATNSGVNFYPRRQPAWTRRKEILIGTQDKVNPTRAMSRRASLIARKLGPATDHYFWMVERIGTKDRTRYWTADAADAQGIHAKTIKRHNKRLKDLGFIEIVHRKHQGQNTYAEYVLNPINELIGDDGHGPVNRGTRLSPGPRDKAVPAKRAKKEKTGTTSVLPSSSPSQHMAAKQAEAGRAGASPATVTAGFATRVDDGWDRDETKAQDTPPGTLLASIKGWVREEKPFLVSCGFKDRPHQSVVKDILTFLESRHEMKNVDPKEQWDTFLTIYPVLKIKLPTVDFIRKGHHSLGVGKLFTPTKGEVNEVYWETIFTSPEYGGIELPDVIHFPGTEILSSHGTRGTVLSIDHRGYTCTVEGTDERMVVGFRAARLYVPPSETVVVASAGISEPLATVERPPTPPEDDEDLERLLAAILAEEGE